MDMVDPSVVLAPYLEPLVRGRRVVVLGDSSGAIGASLIDRGARLVHVYDPDPVRAAESAARFAAERSLVIARLPETDLAVRDGAFDAVIVPDLSVFERPDEIVRRAARLAGTGGAALFASRNLEVPGARPALRGRELSYYELYDSVSLQFAEVRMLGQAPFVGYVIADFAPDDEPDVSVDTSLMQHGAEEPQWFLALASTRPVRLDAYSIVQVPSAPGTAAATAASKEIASELASARGRIGELETELNTQRTALRTLEARQVDPARVEELEEHLKKSEARAGDAHVRAGRLEGKVRDLEEELRHQRDRAFRLSRELEDEKKSRTRAELELSMARRSSDLPRPIEEQPAPLVDEKTVAELEAEKARSARLQRELDDAHARIAELASDLTSARDELDDARAVQTHHAERVRELEAALRDRDARIVKLDTAVLDLEQSAAEAAARPTRDEDLARANQERDDVLGVMAQMRSEQENEVARLEEKLRERGVEIEALRQDSARKEQLVRELVVVFEQARLQGGEGELPGHLVETIASLHGQLDRLAAVAAQRESELQAARWRVQELEQQVAAGRQQEPAADVANLERALGAAQAELDALRKSLAQEHEARSRLESGSGVQEALADAHAQLQQQAVLVTAAEPSDPGSVDR